MGGLSPDHCLSPIRDAAIGFIVVFPAEFFFVQAEVLFGFFGDEVKAQAGFGGQFDVSVFDDPRVLQESFAQTRIDLLLNEKIGHGGVDLHTRGKCDRADGAVGHDVHVVHFGHVGDAFEFGNPASVGGVGLDVRDRMFFEHRAKFPAREQAFARGDGEGHMVGDEFERVDVFLRHGFLDEHGAHALDFTADFDGERGGHFAVKVKAEFAVVADPFAHGVRAFDKVVDRGRGFVGAPLAARPGFERGVSALGLQHVEPLARRGQARFRGVADSPVGIDANAVAHRAAEQLIGGHIEMFARDVPQGLVDAR